METRRRARAGCAGVIVAFALAACGEARPAAPPSFGRPDAGSVAPAAPDAASADAGPNRDDAATPPPDDDAGIGGPGPCDTFVFGDPAVRASVGVSSADAPALAARGDGALLVWVAQVDGQPRVSALGLAFDGGPPSVAGVTDAPSAQRDPAVTATADGYVVAWRDDRDGDFEVFARAVDAAGVPAEALHVLSDDGVDDGPPGVGVNGLGDVLVAWVERGAAPRGRVAVLAPEGVRGTYDVAALATARGAPAIAPLADGGAALAWVDGATGAVRVQRLGEGGQPTGDAHTIAAEGQARGAIDLAAHGDGAVLAYDVLLGGARPELRYQVLDETATPTGAERVVTSAEAAAGSIAPLRTGFVTAYRGGAASGGDAALRLDLFEVGAEAFASTEVAGARLDGTRAVVRTSPDGAVIAVAWVEDGRVLTVSSRCE